MRTAELEAECLRLRREGLTHRAIAARLGVAPATAYRRIRHALDEINERNVEEAASLRDLEVMRLDEMQAALWEQAVDECDTRAIDRVLRIMERRARLLGLDAPVMRETKATPPDPQSARFQHRLLVQQILAEITTEGNDPSH